MNRSVPVAWRSETCVQFGDDEPVLIEGLGVADVKLIQLLRLGISESEYSERAQSWGLSDTRAQSLLALLHEARVLVPRNGRAHDVTHETDALAHALALDPVTVRDVLANTELIASGPFRNDVATLARTCGFSAHTVDQVQPGELSPDTLVVLTSVWAPDLLAASSLVDAGISHRLVNFGQNRAWLSPVIVPGTTPCAGCWATHRTDQDADWLLAWRILRAQNPSPAHIDPLLVAQTLPHALMGLRTFVVEQSPEANVSWVSLPHGDVTYEIVTDHARCDCMSVTMCLPEAASAASMASQ